MSHERGLITGINVHDLLLLHCFIAIAGNAAASLTESHAQSDSGLNYSESRVATALCFGGYTAGMELPSQTQSSRVSITFRVCRDPYDPEDFTNPESVVVMGIFPPVVRLENWAAFSSESCANVVQSFAH